MFTDNELKRYQRHFAINGWDINNQLKLKNASVFVAGAGGLGSVVLYYLAAAGIGRIIFCDSDSVDISNLNRQILYSADDVGKDKVASAMNRLSGLNNDVEFVPLKCMIQDESIPHITGCDLIIDCVDNFETRHILNKISYNNKIPLLHAGVTEFYCQLTFIKPDETPCLGCFMPGETTQVDKGIVGAMAGIAGSIEALEAIKYLSGTGETLANKLLFIDMKSLSFNTINIKKNPECRICSGKGDKDA